MSVCRKLVTIGCTAVLTVSGALMAAPAQAATWITVCNRNTSDDNIRAYNNSVSFSLTIGIGHCGSVNNSGGLARVDVDPSGGLADIDSWRKINAGPDGNWNVTCYVNEDGASNPYNTGITTYWTSGTGWCG